MKETVANLLSKYLKNVRNDPENIVVDLKKLPKEFHGFAEELEGFCNCVFEAGEATKLLSKGCLDIKLPPSSNELAFPIKALHADLRHLTWQTERVAAGDYQQRIDFMGDFSKAFNSMVEKLQLQNKALTNEIEASRKRLNTLSQDKIMYELLSEEICQGVIVADAKTQEWVFVNNDVEQNLMGFEHEPQIRYLIKEQIEILEQGKPAIKEFGIIIEGEKLELSVSYKELKWQGRKVYAFILTDTSYEKRRLAYLQELANFDSMTKIYNRRSIMEELENKLKSKVTFILCFIDLDNLKYVNDMFGHAAGDKYIIDASQLLKNAFANSMAGRIGGDEFMLLIENTNLEEAEEVLENIREIMIETYNNGELPYRTSISYGLVEILESNKLTDKEILTIADERMYIYKREKRKAYREAEKQ